jgi:hypothetical protein
MDQARCSLSFCRGLAPGARNQRMGRARRRGGPAGAAQARIPGKRAPNPGDIRRRRACEFAQTQRRDAGGTAPAARRSHSGGANARAHADSTPASATIGWPDQVRIAGRLARHPSFEFGDEQVDRRSGCSALLSERHGLWPVVAAGSRGERQPRRECRSGDEGEVGVPCWLAQSPADAVPRSAEPGSDQPPGSR